MEKKFFGKTADGVDTYLYTLEGKNIKIEVSDYGSTLVNLFVKDKEGKDVDVVLGYDHVTDYENDAAKYLGCNVGRVANRIGRCKFVLNGEEYTLDQNDGENSLHGGFYPYSKRLWCVDKVTDKEIVMWMLSKDMDQGFPGAIKIYVTYKIESDDSFSITYEGTPDADTIINMTNHSYFNLNGQGTGSILNHTVKLNADKYTPTDANLIPTGEIADVENTPMDYRQGKTIGKDIEEDFEQLKIPGGFDHNFAINGYDGSIKKAAEFIGDKTGIAMDVYTDYPGIQLYTGNFIGNIIGKGGVEYKNHEAVCFEPQFFPDAINHKEFVSPVCKKNETYKRTIKYSFKTA